MLTVPVTDKVEIVHCIQNNDTKVFTDSDEYKLKWTRDIFELVMYLVNVPAQNGGQIISQLSIGQKQMLS